MSISPTHKQDKLLGFIRRAISEDGIAPSYHNMAEAMGLKSKSCIHRMMLGLEERGLIRRIPNRTRAIEIVPPGRSFVPLANEIDALRLIFRVEQFEWLCAEAKKRRIQPATLLREMIDPDYMQAYSDV